MCRLWAAHLAPNTSTQRTRGNPGGDTDHLARARAARTRGRATRELFDIYSFASNQMTRRQRAALTKERKAWTFSFKWRWHITNPSQKHFSLKSQDVRAHRRRWCSSTRPSVTLSPLRMYEFDKSPVPCCKYLMFTTASSAGGGGALPSPPLVNFNEKSKVKTLFQMARKSII